MERGRRSIGKSVHSIEFETSAAANDSVESPDIEDVQKMTYEFIASVRWP
jgi:hypothetical protein